MAMIGRALIKRIPAKTTIFSASARCNSAIADHHEPQRPDRPLSRRGRHEDGLHLRGRALMSWPARRRAGAVDRGGSRLAHAAGADRRSRRRCSTAALRNRAAASPVFSAAGPSASSSRIFPRPASIARPTCMAKSARGADGRRSPPPKTRNCAPMPTEARGRHARTWTIYSPRRRRPKPFAASAGGHARRPISTLSRSSSDPSRAGLARSPPRGPPRPSKGRRTQRAAGDAPSRRPKAPATRRRSTTQRNADADRADRRCTQRQAGGGPKPRE